MTDALKHFQVHVKVYTLVELTPTMFTVWLAVVLNKLLKKETWEYLIDNQLKFHDHVSMVIGKARRLLGLINKSFINLSPP